MSKSILTSMIDGYLFVVRGFDQPYHGQYRKHEADRIAIKIRDIFGKIDESSEQSCAWVIKAVMKDEPDIRASQPRPAKPKSNPQAEQDRMLAEFRRRKERDERLRKTEWF